MLRTPIEMKNIEFDRVDVVSVVVTVILLVTV
jgi:hypothetical protein